MTVYYFVKLKKKLKIYIQIFIQINQKFSLRKIYKY